MSADPIDDGGPAYPRGLTVTADGRVWTTSQTGQSFRADVAKACLAALASREDVDHCTPATLADAAVNLSDALIARLKGGPR